MEYSEKMLNFAGRSGMKPQGYARGGKPYRRTTIYTLLIYIHTKETI